MPAIERVIPIVGQLPASIRDMLLRQLRGLMGLGLIGLSGVTGAALMTWSVQDPSLSHATSRAIRNIMGYPGAIGADLLMQILGLGAIMMLLTVAVWGWRMLTRRHFDCEALRLACWILCTIFAAGFASCWPHGGAWPLPTGLGGVVGDALVRAPALVLGPLGVFYRIIFGVLFFAAMVASFLFASGLGSQERELSELEEDDAPLEDDDDRGSVSLGFMVHAAMSAKARLVRLLSAAYRSLVASGPDAQEEGSAVAMKTPRPPAVPLSAEASASENRASHSRRWTCPTTRAAALPTGAPTARSAQCHHAPWEAASSASPWARAQRG